MPMKAITRKSKQGQSMTEYLVILTLILLALFLFLSKTGRFAQSYNTILLQHGQDIKTTSKRIFF